MTVIRMKTDDPADMAEFINISRAVCMAMEELGIDNLGGCSEDELASFILIVDTYRGAGIPSRYALNPNCH